MAKGCDLQVLAKAEFELEVTFLYDEEGHLTSQVGGYVFRRSQRNQCQRTSLVES